MDIMRIRRYEARLPEGEVGSLLERVFAATEGAPVRFFIEGANEGLLERYPSLAVFADKGALLNFDARWDLANPAACEADVPREVLVEIGRPIDNRPQAASLPYSAFVVVIGPVAWPGTSEEPREIAGRMYQPGKPCFSTRFPSLTYIAPSVIIQRLGSGTLAVAITEFGDESSAAVVGLANAIGASESHLREVMNRPAPLASAIAAAASGTAAEVHKQFREKFGEYIAAIEFPHTLPTAAEVLNLPRAPIGEIRKAIVGAFKADGWKKSTAKGAGTHRLYKDTPGGRRLFMNFDTGSWLRQVTGFMTLASEAGVFRVILQGDPKVGGQHLAPNPEVFGNILENLTVLVRKLEQDWVPRIESALGPVPEGYRPPEA
jgi:hypothetical protein